MSLLALLARLAAVEVAGRSSAHFGDARAYLFAAGELSRTGRYPLRTDAFFFRPPGYPVFLAAVTLGRPWQRIAAGKIAGALVGAVAAPLLALLSARLFQRRTLALATGVLGAVHPGFLRDAGEIQSEPLFLVLLLGAGLSFLAAADRPSANLALLSGFLLALAALTRPSALGLAPLLLSLLLDRRWPLRARTHLASAALLGLLLALLPWTIRNAIVARRFLPVSDVGGVSFYHGNSRWAVRFYELRSRADYDRWIVALDRDMRGTAAQYPREDPSRLFFRLALRERLERPAETAKLLARKSLDWLWLWPSPWFWPPGWVAIVGLYYASLAACAGLGLLFAPRRGAALFAFGVLALSMATHVFLLVVWRYRTPYWDPVLLLHGMFGAALLLSRTWRVKWVG